MPPDPAAAAGAAVDVDSVVAISISLSNLSYNIVSTGRIRAFVYPDATIVEAVKEVVVEKPKLETHRHAHQIQLDADTDTAQTNKQNTKPHNVINLVYRDK